jgi:hypothetical protein
MEPLFAATKSRPVARINFSLSALYLPAIAKKQHQGQMRAVKRFAKVKLGAASKTIVQQIRAAFSLLPRHPWLPRG